MTQGARVGGFRAIAVSPRSATRLQQFLDGGITDHSFRDASGFTHWGVEYEPLRDRHLDGDFCLH
jgi:hypothetical protein